MSVHVIYFKDGAKMMRPVLKREDYIAMRNSQRQMAVLAAVRSGDKAQKSHLLQFNYSCLPGADGALKGCKTASSSVGMDIDFVPPEGLTPEERASWLDHEMQRVPDLVLSKREELGLLMLERSATKGYHLVFRRHAELSQEDNLRWASSLLGVRYDEGAKDITRVFFTTSADPHDLLFLDDELFCVSASQCLSSPSPHPMAPLSPVDAHAKAKAATPHVAYDPTATYNGFLFSDIIATYWELFYEGKTPVEGDRNPKTYELAVLLAPICDYSLERLMAVVPNYWGEEGSNEWRATIENALKAPRRGFPFHLKQVLAELSKSAVAKACGGTLSTPPPLPRRLPPLIRLLTSKVPDCYKPAVASAVFPSLAAHLHGVKFRYWDNVDHEATFMNVLIGRQSVGKGSIKKPIEYITADIRQRDLPNRQREAEWKQKNPSAKQKKDPRPNDICIQLLIDNLTDAVFNQRIVDANNNGERYLYTFVDEVEALKKVTSRGTADEVGLLIRKGFDNALAGQERVGADSVSGIAPLRWNFNASTTPPNACRFFGKMVNNGTVSRLDIATIIRNPDDDTPPVMGIYDHKFAAELKPYIDRLEAASGLIECPQGLHLSAEMRDENRDNAALSESQAFRVLSYRANVIAFLKGMVLFVAHGNKWSKAIADFVRWSQQYDLWCKMLYFGRQLEKELGEETMILSQSGPKNLLDLLPDEFSREQYMQMRQTQGRSDDGGSTLRTWTNRGYIVFDNVTGNYCKTDTYLLKHPSTRSAC